MDQRTLAFINLYAVFGALEKLCQIVPEASVAVAGQSLSVAFVVKDGPAATLLFHGGGCQLKAGADHCDIRLSFSSAEKFNAMLDGTYTPIPSRGLLKAGFLTGPFQKLTDLLSRYLKADAADLADPQFFADSTKLLFYVVVAAIAQIGNEDHIGRHSAANIVDGRIRFSIDGGPSAHLSVQNHRLQMHYQDCGEAMSYMQFANIETARALFDGQVNAAACVGQGQIRVGGMMSQIDNVNRILNRVARYLA